MAKHLNLLSERPLISATQGVVFQWIKRLPLFWIAVLSGMTSLLIMVAVLQYRWTKQLSVATQDRIGSNLQPLMLGWHLDFYGELSAICVALQVGPDSGARDDWDDYLHRYIKWSHAPINPESVENIYANPGVVKSIYVWQTAGKAIPRLLRLDPGAARIQPSSIPKNLQPLLAQLQAKSSSLSIGLHAWESTGSFADELSRNNEGNSTLVSQRTDLTTGWQFDPKVPAIVHPIMDTRHHFSRSDTEPSNGQDPVNWIVVVLNLDYIQNSVFPNLMKRDFSSREGLEYKLAVIAAGRTPRVIYSSDLGFPSSNESSVDSRMNIFGHPPQSVEGDFWEVIKNRESIRNEDWRSFTAPVWFPIIQYGSNNGPWTLLVQHRTGPLEAITTSIWHRNLLTSGIVLLLLTCGMYLIAFATLRAQKLAHLRLDFVANVSHELLTPIAAVHSVGQNLMDGLCDTKADSILSGSNITGQTRQLTDMVKQILLFVSTQDGSIRYTLCPLDVSEIINTVRKNVAMLVESNGFEVDQQVQEGLPNVMGDLPALSQCLQNLITNGVKYSGKNRWIRISASVHGAKTNQWEVRISVQDHGRGISNSELGHIFEPFYRSPKVVDAQIHGTGLGLAVAKRIAHAMGGRLSVISELDMGSTFTLHLPVALRSDAETSKFVPDSTLVRKHE
jgi:signal transduction histidine kinase